MPKVETSEMHTHVSERDEQADEQNRNIWDAEAVDTEEYLGSVALARKAIERT